MTANEQARIFINNFTVGILYMWIDALLESNPEEAATCQSLLDKEQVSDEKIMSLAFTVLFIQVRAYENS